MCVEVLFDDGDTFPAWEAETQGALSQRLGGPLVEYGGATVQVDANQQPLCLCPIDLDATAARYGLKHDTDGIDHVFRLPSTPAHFD